MPHQPSRLPPLRPPSRRVVQRSCVTTAAKTSCAEMWPKCRYGDSRLVRVAVGMVVVVGVAGQPGLDECRRAAHAPRAIRPPSRPAAIGVIDRQRRERRRPPLEQRRRRPPASASATSAGRCRGVADAEAVAAALVRASSCRCSRSVRCTNARYDRARPERPFRASTSGMMPLESTASMCTADCAAAARACAGGRTPGTSR